MHLRYVLHFHLSLSSTGILPALILSTVTLRGYSHPSKCSPLPSPCAEIPRNRILKPWAVKISLSTDGVYEACAPALSESLLIHCKPYSFSDCSGPCLWVGFSFLPVCLPVVKQRSPSLLWARNLVLLYFKIILCI